MKQIIFIILFSITLLAQVPTSRFNRYFQYTDGSPLTGVAIELIRQSNTYPTGRILLIEHSSRPGYYYKDGIGNGEYKIYVGGNLYEEKVWIGENRLSIIADKFNSSIEMSGRDLIDTSIVSTKLKDQAVIWDKLADAVKDSIRGAPTGQYLTANSVDSSHIKNGTVTGSDLKTIISGTHFYTVWAGLDGGYFTLPWVQQIWTPSQKFLMYKQEDNVTTAQLRIILGQHDDVNNGADTIAYLSDVRTTGGGGGGLGINTVDSTHIKNGGIGLADLSSWTRFILDSGRVATTGDDFIYGKICAYNDFKFARGMRLGYSGEFGFTTDIGEMWFRLGESRFYGRYSDDESDYFLMGRDLAGFTGSNKITTLGTITLGTWAGSTISINKGGTGATTKNSAINNLMPSQTNKNGKFPRSNGTDVSWQQITLDTSNTGGLSNTLYSKYNSHKLFLDVSGDGGVQDTFPSLAVLRGIGLGGTFAIRSATDYQETSIQDGEVLRWVAESPGYFVNDSIIPGFYNDSGKVLSNDGIGLKWVANGGALSDLSDVSIQLGGGIYEPYAGTPLIADGFGGYLVDGNSLGDLVANDILIWDAANSRYGKRQLIDSIKNLDDVTVNLIDGIYDPPVGTPLIADGFGGFIIDGALIPNLVDNDMLLWDATNSLYKKRQLIDSLKNFDDVTVNLIDGIYDLALGTPLIADGFGAFIADDSYHIADFQKNSKSSFVDWQGYNANLTLLPDSQNVIFKTTYETYIDSIVAVTGDSSVTINFYYASQRDSLTNTKGTKLFSSNQVITNKTTGTVFTTGITNRVIPKNNFVCFSVREKAGKTDENIFVEIYYRKNF